MFGSSTPPVAWCKLFFHSLLHMLAGLIQVLPCVKRLVNMMQTGLQTVSSRHSMLLGSKQ
jgi:hypothetical protein